VTAIIIRTAAVEDGWALAAAERKHAETPGKLVSRPNEIDPTMFADRILRLSAHSRGRYIVAEIGGKIAGHAILEPMGLEAISHIVRLTMVVHPGFERRGVGTTLLRDLIQWATTNPLVHKVELNVRASNKAALELYKLNGFKEEGRLGKRIRLPDGTFVDDVLMALMVPTQK